MNLPEPVLLFDTETRGLVPELGETIFAGALSWEGSGKILVFQERNPLDMEEMIRILRSAGTIVAHNAKFDIRQLIVSLGIDLTDLGYIFDTLVAARLLLPGQDQYGLKPLTSRISAPGSEKDVKQWLRVNKMGHDYSKVPDRILEPYLMGDIVRLAYLFRILRPRLDRMSEASEKILRCDLALIRPVVRMECRGLPLDVGKLDEARHTFETRRSELVKMVPWKIGSHAGLEMAFRDRLGPSPRRTSSSKAHPGGQICFDSMVLKGLRDQHVQYAREVLEYRHVTKILTTYIKPWERYRELERLHGTFNISGAHTGRMSSSNPNLQNIIRELRRVIVAESGCVLVEADYSSMEIHAAALLSGDPAFLRAAEGDFHQETALKLFNNPGDKDRAIAKTINFAILYGSGKTRIRDFLRQSLGRPIPWKEVHNLYDRYWAAFPRFHQWVDYQKRVARQGGIVFDPLGRRVVGRPYKAYAMVNWIIQGFCAGVAKQAFLRLFRAGLDIRAVVHDSVLCMVDRAHVSQTCELIHRMMPIAKTDRGPMLFPITIKIGDSWAKDDMISETSWLTS